MNQTTRLAISEVLLQEKISDLKIPNHIAITPDGTRTWVQRDISFFPTAYRSACDQAYNICHHCLYLGVRALTLWGFSTENWKRPARERAIVFSVIEEFIRSKQNELHELGVHVNHFGDPAQLPQSLRRALRQVREMTQENEGFYLNLAVNYGGQAEITRAINLILQEKLTTNDPTPVTTADIENKLYTGVLPRELRNPDLMIRTGGSSRDSGYLLYQGAYTPKYWTSILWPDFDKMALVEALKWYTSVQQNYGA